MTYIVDIICALISAGSVVFNVLYIRRYTRISELEKGKAHVFNEVINPLILSGKLTYSELYSSKNYEIIARKADEFIREEGIFPEKIENLDWHHRFYQASVDISDENVQEIWARILAGEIKEPGTYSLRTLDVLKNMSQEDASLFLKVLRGAIPIDGKLIIPNDNEYLWQNEITYEDILNLSEMNVLYSESTLYLNLDVDAPYKGLIHNTFEMILITIPDDVRIDSWKITCYMFTHIGTELSALQKTDVTGAQLRQFAKFLNRNSTGFRASLHKLDPLDPTYNTFFKVDLLTGEEIEL